MSNTFADKEQRSTIKRDTIFLPFQTLSRYFPLQISKAWVASASSGRKKVVLRNRRIGQHLEKFEAAYAKLKAGGGFETLRSGIGNKLAFVQPLGTTVPYLRDQVVLGQALAYLWPLKAYVCMYVIYRIFDKPVCCCTNTVRNAFLFWVFVFFSMQLHEY